MRSPLHWRGIVARALAAAAALTSACGPERAVAPVSATLPASSALQPRALPALYAGGIVGILPLHDQVANYGQGATVGVFAGVNMVADDFEVPTGGWTIGDIVLSGASAQGAVVRIEIRPDANNVPGSAPVTLDANGTKASMMAPPANMVANTCSCGVTDGTTGGQIMDYAYAVPNWQLPAGRYWLVVTVKPVGSNVSDFLAAKFPTARFAPAMTSTNGGAFTDAAPGLSFALFGARLADAVTLSQDDQVSPMVGITIDVPATSTSGLPVFLSLTKPTDVCTVVGARKLQLNHAGICQVVGSTAGTTLYLPGTSDPFDISVGQAYQQITFTSTPPNPAIVGGTYAISASASSGYPVKFLGNSDQVCTYDNGTVTFLAVGKCQIIAAQDGGRDYFSAPLVDQTFTVTDLLPQTIAFTSTPPSPAPVGTTYSVSATGGASGKPVTFTTSTPSVCSVSGSTVSFATTGTCTVLADQAGATGYAPATQVPQNVTVSKGAQSITITSTPPSPAAPNGTYAVLATGGASGNALAYSSQTPSICTTAGNVVTFVLPGTCIVAVDQGGNGNYTAALTATQQITVAKLSQAITFTTAVPTSPKLNGTYVVGATGGASGNPVVLTAAPATVCTISGATVTFVGVGTCTVTANQAGNAVYTAALPAKQTIDVKFAFGGFMSPIASGTTFNVAKAGQTIAVKWRLTNAAGAPVTSLASATIATTDVACPAGPAPTNNVADETTAGNSGLQNLGNGYYQLNWKTPTTYKNTCKALGLTLADGSTYSALFQFTK